MNWFGLIPGVGTIGWGHHDPATGEFHVDRPLLRGGNADLNMTTAMAASVLCAVVGLGDSGQGVGGFLKHLFGPKGETTGILKVLMVVIFFMVGWLEVISILFRPSLAEFSIVREHLCRRKHFGSDGARWCRYGWRGCRQFHFIFWKILVGVVQALVFMLLTAVFTMLIAQHDQGPEHAH